MPVSRSQFCSGRELRHVGVRGGSVAAVGAPVREGGTRRVERTGGGLVEHQPFRSDQDGMKYLVWHPIVTELAMTIRRHLEHLANVSIFFEDDDLRRTLDHVE